ncbi:Adenylate kinase family protein [Tritrichomonas foetus]|uniref:Adenylate kinase family protein n=1 Tax=Tritrichomonas foetus TaxID=1144522 RepID=A0A1J4K9K9_9EUKA|nr:Adenylate kinase family protein [Tritrichomonas foetus]|eukprot:OHT07600.1 Adenylate kinase family protein [Tritrichomonas foetus]
MREADKEKEERAQQFAKKVIIFLIGGPGSGKGTQAERIIKDYDVGYMSAGELLRKEAASGSDQGNWINEQMKLGNILPAEITVGLLKKEIIEQDKDFFLIDGFPRKIDQAEIFENTVCPCACSLFLDVPDDVLVERLIERSKDSGRDDDNPETIKLRIQTFHEVSEQVFDYFTQFGKAVKIDGNRDPDEVYEDVKMLLNKILNKDQEPENTAEEEETKPEEPSESQTPVTND